MPLNPFTLKQMKDGTLTTLRMQGQAVDERDLRAINNFLRTTQSLKTLDLTYSHGMLEQFADALKENKSITKLSVGQIVQDHNMSVLLDVLKHNTSITQLNLDNNYFQGPGITALARFIKEKDTLTHLSLENVNVNDEDITDFARGGRRRMGAAVDRIAKAVGESANILEVSPGSAETDSVCIANKAAAETLLKSAQTAPESLSATEIENFAKRLPAILHLAENGKTRDRTAVAQMLLGVEDAAGLQGASFTIPARYEDIAAQLPRPFHAAAEKVDFGKLAAKDFDGALHKAVAAGQTDELLSYMKAHKRTFNAGDCLAKPEGARENVIELIARQGKLAEVMTVENWTGDARGLKAAIAAVPAREWRRQMKDTPAEQLIYQVNAATFKKARQAPKP